MKKLKLLLGLAVLSAAILFTGCNGSTGMDDSAEQTSVVAGKAIFLNSGSSEGITVSIEKSNGLTTSSVINAIEENARVAVIDGTCGITTTDANGNYSFEGVKAGLYTIYAASNDSSEKAVMTNIVVETGRSVTVEDLKLTPVGSITGKVLIDNKTTGNFGVEVYIPGTSYAAKTADDGSFTISSVPAGSYGLAINKGYFDYMWKASGVTVTVGTAYDAGILSTITSEDIKLGYKDGEDGTSISWLGAFASSDEIENPVKLNAYYNTKDGCSYIYDGTKWTLLAKAGAKGAAGSSESDGSSVKNASAYPTEHGIMFLGYIPNNISVDGYVYDSTSSKCGFWDESDFYATINITEKASGITLVKSYSTTYIGNGTWSTVYPFVEAGKDYEFNVDVYYKDYTFYSEDITVTASGGLGEYTITNSSSYESELTADKVIKRTGIPEFSNNPDVEVEACGIRYCLRSNYDDRWLWIYEFINWSPLDKNSFPLKDAEYYSGSSILCDYNYINNCLSGRKYKIYTQTILKVAGYTDNDSTYFRMGDFSEKIDEWGGETVKVLMVYGLSDPDDPTNYTYYYTYEDFTESTELTDASGEKHTIVSTLTNMPGSEIKAVISDNEITYPYAQLVDFGSTVYEPDCIPAIKMTFDGKDYTEATGEAVPYEFSKWNTKFPLTAESSEAVTVDGKKCYVAYITAAFKASVAAYTVKYLMNDGTDTVYYSRDVRSDNGAAGKGWRGSLYPGFPSDDPVREGYSFSGWYTDAECTNQTSEREAVTAWIAADAADPYTAYLYAKWEAK